MKILGAIGIQALLVGIFLVFRLAVLTGGTEVVLNIEPVDPRDPLRGDYVTYRYEIGRMPAYYFKDFSSGRPLENETVYVELQEYGRYWGAVRVAPKPPKDGVFVKALVTYAPPAPGPEFDGGYDLFLERQQEYQLSIQNAEQYFIPEGTGRTFNFTNRTAQAVLSVDSNGDVVVKELLVDGKRWP